MAIEDKTFRELCCRQLAISPEDFEATVFWKCLPFRHRFIGWWVWQFKRSFFKQDLELIQAVADCTSMSDLRVEMNAYLRHHQIAGFQRKVLRVRISGYRLQKLASGVFASESGK